MLHLYKINKKIELSNKKLKSNSIFDYDYILCDETKIKNCVETCIVNWENIDKILSKFTCCSSFWYSTYGNKGRIYQDISLKTLKEERDILFGIYAQGVERDKNKNYKIYDNELTYGDLKDILKNLPADRVMQFLQEKGFKGMI